MYFFRVSARRQFFMTFVCFVAADFAAIGASEQFHRHNHIGGMLLSIVALVLLAASVGAFITGCRIFWAWLKVHFWWRNA